jgi:hypothetical protein
LLDFIELKPFTNAWDSLGLDDDALTALQLAIMVDPTTGDVIPGTGGLRKMRFAPHAWHQGKRGALRVCYVYFAEYGIVLLVIVYAKSEKDDLSHAEKTTIRDLIERQEKELSRRPSR